MSTSVFISYRRSDAEGEAGRLQDRLARRLGKKNVFWDREDVGPADDFIDRIAEVMAEVDLVIAVIGPEWASPANIERLQNPDDWVRRELEAGLRSASTKVAIAVVDDGRWPPKAELPESLRPLRSINAWPIRSDQFDHDVDYFCKKLDLGDRRRTFTLVAGLAVLVAALIGAAMTLLPGPGPTSTQPEASDTTEEPAQTTTTTVATTTTQEGSTATTEPVVEVPQTENLTQAAAVAVVESAGFATEIRGTASGIVSEGRVVRSDPQGGVPLPTGEIVTLVVSAGPSPYCPQLAPGGSMVVGLDSSSGYAEFQEDGTIDGFEPSLLNALMLQLCGDTSLTYQVMTAADRFTALQSGQVDLALIQARFSESAGILYSTPYVLVDVGVPKAIALMGNDPELRAEVDAALVELIVSGIWLEIHEQWLGPPSYTTGDMLSTPLPG